MPPTLTPCPAATVSIWASVNAAGPFLAPGVLAGSAAKATDVMAPSARAETSSVFMVALPDQATQPCWTCWPLSVRAHHRQLFSGSVHQLPTDVTRHPSAEHRFL